MAETITVKAQLIDNMTAEMKKIQQNMDKGFTSIQSDGKKTAKSMKGVGNSLLSLKNVAIGLTTVLIYKLGRGLVSLGKSAVGASSEFETLETQFITLLGSTEAAKARMMELAQFAATTPFQLPGIANASRVLETLTKGALATGSGLRMVGDVAASTGTDFQELSVHVGRLYDGLKANRPVGESMMRMQELGIISGEVRGKIEALQKQAKGTEAWVLMRSELDKFKGGMTRLSTTLSGLTSTIKDQLNMALIQMMESGVMDSLKTALTDIIDKVGEALENGTFVRLGKAITKMVPAVTFAAKWTVRLVDALTDLFAKGDEGIVLQSEAMKKVLTGLQNDQDKLVSKFRKNLAWQSDEAKHQFDVLGRRIKAAKEQIQEYLKAEKDLEDGPEKPPKKPPKTEPTGPTAQALAKAAARHELILGMREQMEDAKLDLIQDSFDKEMAMLDVQKQRELTKYKKDGEAKFLIKKKYEAKMLDVSERRAEAERQLDIQTTKSIVGNMLQLADMFKTENKAMFDLAKGLAMAQAIMNTGEAVTKALTAGPIAGPIAAGIIGILGGAQVGLIAATQYKAAAKGIDYTTSGPEMLMVGDNPGGRERVQVTPIGSPNMNGPNGSGVGVINVDQSIIIEGPVTEETIDILKGTREDQLEGMHQMLRELHQTQRISWVGTV